jgi:hypothetical protein
MVTHSSTSRPVQCLCMAERTGCPVFTDLWSYVLVLLIFNTYPLAVFAAGMIWILITQAFVSHNRQSERPRSISRHETYEDKCKNNGPWSDASEIEFIASWDAADDRLVGGGILC